MSLNFTSPTNAYALGKIVINDANNNPVKKFILNTDYFQSPNGNQDFTTKRLRLNSVTEFNGNESARINPYLFTYENPNGLPTKTSSCQDHWGFFNGKNNVDNLGFPILIPSYTGNYFISVSVQQSGGTPAGYSVTPGPLRCPDPNATGCTITSPHISTFQFNGADRSADFSSTKTGILTRIQYPTGGYTTFEYEPHDYDLKNYIYKQGSGGAICFATCCDPLANPVTTSGDQYYVDKTFIPNTIIPNNLVPVRYK
ncbi:hypothetical protein [Mucilaginibacter sp. OK268]|uniref:hypothetical protein n=1 Tax=Mucilaginibacter sp. OK268 TaxID=1881048 RepID=UPI000B843656|nr:hypothetical protein [Mucilaginibacter sp. OK268]